MLNLASWLRRLGNNGRKATKLYGSIVTQTRVPAFYTDYGVPDTINGRYELLVLHLSFALSALRQTEGAAGPLSRGLVEAFVTDMDDTMRQLAVGDTSVPRKVKKVAAGLMDRAQAYQAALAADNDKELKACIADFFQLPKDAQHVLALASYARVSERSLASLSADIRDKGQISFPDPALCSAKDMTG